MHRSLSGSRRTSRHLSEPCHRHHHQCRRHEGFPTSKEEPTWLPAWLPAWLSAGQWQPLPPSTASTALIALTSEFAVAADPQPSDFQGCSVPLLSFLGSKTLSDMS